MRTVHLLPVLGLLVLIGAGCQNAVHDENQSLHGQNRELQAKLNQQVERNRQLEGLLAAKDQEIARLKAQAVTVAPPQPDPQPDVKGLEGMDTTYDAKAGTLTVNLAGDVLFEPGKADLKPAAKASLDKVLAALNNQYKAKPVRIEGHTDTDPIKASANLWKDNMELSLARAKAVEQYLRKAGLDYKRLAHVGGSGEHAPRGPDKTKNRRVEIIVETR